MALCQSPVVDMFPITGMCPKSVDMILTNRQNVDFVNKKVIKVN